MKHLPLTTTIVHRFVALLLGGAALSAQSQTPALEALQRRINAASAEAVADCSVASMAYNPTGKSLIYPRAGKTVTIGLQPDEVISTVIWDEPKRGDYIDAFVYPDRRGLTVRVKSFVTVPGVVTTNVRRYFIQLTPTEPGPGAICHQGVLFTGSDSAEGGFNPFGITVAPTGTSAASLSEVAPTDRPANDVFSGTPNFGYTSTGEANFKPVAVYDNGRFTWIQMGASTQSLPAVFYNGPNGLEVVNYTVINNGSGLLVNRLMERFVLRLGASEVNVTANGTRR